MKFSKLLTILFFACYVQGFAANYYVSRSGNNGNNGQSPGAAFATLQHAHDQTNPGDVVHIMNGTYAATSGDLLVITNSGTDNSPIIYKAYSGHSPKLVAAKGTACWAVIRIKASNIHIDGLELMGDNDNISLSEGEAVHDHYLANRESGTVNWAYAASTNTNGIYIRGEDDDHIGPKNIVIKNCLIYKFPGAGITSEVADYVTIDKNTVHSNAWYMMYAGSGISVFHPWNSDENTSTYRNFVRKNVVYNNETKVKWAGRNRYSDGNGIIIDDFKNNQVADPNANSNKQYRLNYKGKTLVVNNVSYGNGACGINVFSSKNVDVIHNTVYDNNASPNLDWPDLEVNASDNVNLRNNIVFATRGKAYGIHNNNNVSSNYNLYHNGSVTGSGPNDIIGVNPNFVNRWSADFRLNSTSPAINSGTLHLAAYTDISDNSRPVGGEMDMGAYEYMGAATTTQNIYTDWLENDWSDWGWGSSRNFYDNSPVKSGSSSLSVNITSNYGGLSLRKGSGVSASNLNSIKFWVFSTTARTMTLQTQSEDGAGAGASNAVSFTTSANAWKEITVSRAQLGNPSLIKRINFTANNFTGEINLDEIRLINGGSIQMNALDSQDKFVKIEEVLTDGLAGTIYPNPVSREMSLSIQASKGDMIFVSISSLKGDNIVKINKTADIEGENKVVVNVESIANGAYIIQYGNQHKIKSGKIIIEK